jgi:hypothetical protein
VSLAANAAFMKDKHRTHRSVNALAATSHMCAGSERHLRSDPAHSAITEGVHLNLRLPARDLTMMAANTEPTLEPPRARRMLKIVLSAVLVILAAIGLLVWHVADAPVGYPRDFYLAYLARSSTEAKAVLEAYRARHRRTTVAERHFDAVCAIMIHAARRQGVQPENFATEMTHECEWNGKDIKEIP